MAGNQKNSTSSLLPYSRTDGLVDIPLYAISALKDEIAGRMA